MSISKEYFFPGYGWMRARIVGETSVGHLRVNNNSLQLREDVYELYFLHVDYVQAMYR